MKHRWAFRIAVRACQRRKRRTPWHKIVELRAWNAWCRERPDMCAARCGVPQLTGQHIRDQKIPWRYISWRRARRGMESCDV